MAKETAAEKQLREALLELPDIVKATQASEGGYLFTDFLVYSPLINEGLVVINEGITNEVGEVATRATEKGIEKVMSETVNEAPLVEQKFKIVNIPLPTVKRAGTRKSQYDFDSLEVGQSFFVPATAEKPDPAKSLASTVNLAMKKYDVPLLDENDVQKTKEITVPRTGEKRTINAMKHTRVFKIVAISDGKDYGYTGVSGAAIGRVA